MSSTRRTLALLALAALAACDQPARRERHLAPRPVPAAAQPGASTPAAPGAPGSARLFPDDPPSPVLWNPGKNAFEFRGRPLRAEKIWTFDGATDGFVATHGDVLPAAGTGLSLTVGGRDTILRTPRGLNVAGANRSLVLVRLTRTGAAKRLDPTAYYSTVGHGESGGYNAKPVFGGHPRLNDTVTMVFDMHRLAAGGDDWKTSTIDQVRLDLDDGPGGAFVIRQVAIAQDPGDLFPAQPAPAKKIEPEGPEATPKAAPASKSVEKPAAKKAPAAPAKPKAPAGK